MFARIQLLVNWVLDTFPAWLPEVNFLMHSTPFWFSQISPFILSQWSHLNPLWLDYFTRLDLSVCAYPPCANGWLRNFKFTVVEIVFTHVLYVTHWIWSLELSFLVVVPPSLECCQSESKASSLSLWFPQYQPVSAYSIYFWLYSQYLFCCQYSCPCYHNILL